MEFVSPRFLLRQDWMSENMASEGELVTVLREVRDRLIGCETSITDLRLVVIEFTEKVQDFRSHTLAEIDRVDSKVKVLGSRVVKLEKAAANGGP